MLFPVAFTIVFALSHALEDDLKSRIMYAQNADIADFPFYAALENCGAAIISESWLVTAARCVAFNDHTFGSVWVGGNDTRTSQKVKYDAVVIHPEFKSVDFFLSNDIALLRLAEPLNFSATIKPVDLSENHDKSYYGQDHTFYYEQDHTVYYDPYDMTMTVVGKGMREVSNGKLMRVDVTPLSLEECLKHFSLAERILMYLNRYKLDEYLCTKRDTNVYHHDMPGLSEEASGSPLVNRNVLRGLAVSFSGPSQSAISMFIKITGHTEWIRFITGVGYRDNRPQY